jgi:hypothetical protein
MAQLGHLCTRPPGACVAPSSAVVRRARRLRGRFRDRHPAGACPYSGSELRLTLLREGTAPRLDPRRPPPLRSPVRSSTDFSTCPSLSSHMPICRSFVRNQELKTSPGPHRSGALWHDQVRNGMYPLDTLVTPASVHAEVAGCRGWLLDLSPRCQSRRLRGVGRPVAAATRAAVRMPRRPAELLGLNGASPRLVGRGLLELRVNQSCG